MEDVFASLLVFLSASPHPDAAPAVDNPVVPPTAGEMALYNVLLVLLPFGIWTYSSVLRKTLSGEGRVRTNTLGWPEVFVTLVLSGLLVALVASIGFHADAGEASTPSGRQIVAGVFLDSAIKLMLVSGLLLGLVSRGISISASFGIDRLSTGGAILRAAGFLLAAEPLVYGMMRISYELSGGGNNQGTEEAVRLFTAGQDLPPKLAMILAAVVIAPIVEEVVFRGYIYGTLRRVLGPAPAILINALLFAAIHLHLPSFGGLFALAVCLTLAYESTGSLLVPMSMHALFNSISIAFLIWGVDS